MRLTILGSGGAIPTPQPYCQCAICQKARKKGEPYKRNNSSLFIENINTVIDCGEDIKDSLNRQEIKQVDNLFITHWHPDHTFGIRNVLEPNLDFSTGKVRKSINVYIPKKVYKTLQKRFPVIDYYLNVQKTGKLHLVENGDKIKIKDITLTVIGYVGKESDTYAYLIECKGKKILYAPCDTISFKNYINFKNLDLLINECGIFSNIDSEISFEELIRRLKEIKPKKTILTHIEELELKKFGEKHFKDMQKKYSDINLEYAFDGMKINV